jgi:hypothetical protein
MKYWVRRCFPDLSSPESVIRFGKDLEWWGNERGRKLFEHKGTSGFYTEFGGRQLTGE